MTLKQYNWKDVFELQIGQGSDTNSGIGSSSRSNTNSGATSPAEVNPVPSRSEPSSVTEVNPVPSRSSTRSGSQAFRTSRYPVEPRPEKVVFTFKETDAFNAKLKIAQSSPLAAAKLTDRELRWARQQGIDLPRCWTDSGDVIEMPPRAPDIDRVLSPPLTAEEWESSNKSRVEAMARLGRSAKS